MKRLQLYARKLRLELEELDLQRGIIENQLAELEKIIEKRKVDGKVADNVVAVKLAETKGKKLNREHQGQPTVAVIISEILAGLEAPVPIRYILEKITEKRPNTPEASIYYALQSGLKQGLFKRVVDKKKHYWSLNTVKAEAKTGLTRSPHNRPNYGIERAVAAFVNQQERGILMSPYFILMHLQDDFPDASEKTIESVLSRWNCDKKPGMAKKKYGNEVSYVFNQPVKI